MRLLLASLLLHLSFTLIGQQIIDQECGSFAGPEEIEFMRSFGDIASASLDDDTIVYIPVNYFLCRRTDGTGGLNPDAIPSLTDELNAYYIHAGVQFYQCNDINFIDSTEYYDFVSNQEQEVCGPRDRFGAMNVYFFNTVKSASGGGLCGYAYFPGSRRDRIVMSNACALNGSTFVHEVGHFFSLYHTHGKTNSGTTDELVDGSNCQNAGDDVCDTPADPNLNGKVNRDCEYTGTATDANGDAFEPDPYNIMSYSRKECRDFMSPGQYERVTFSARFHRPYFEPCCSDTFKMLTHVTPIRCAGDENGKIEVVEANGFGKMTYSWSVPGDSTVIDSLSAGAYVARVTDRLGCTISDTIILDDPTSPGGALHVTPEHCGGTNGRISIDSFQGQGPVSWLLMRGVDTMQILEGLSAGAYTIHFSDSAGCVSLDSLNIGYVNLPTSGLPEVMTRYCEKDSLRYPVLSLTDSNWIAAWVDTTGQLIPVDSLAGDLLASGSYVLQIQDTLWQCMAFDTILVADSLIDLRPLVQPSVSNFRLLLTDLTEEPVSRREWSIDGLVDSLQQFSFLSPGTGWVRYCLELENLCGTAILCDSVFIPGFQVQLDASDPPCADGVGKINLEITGDSLTYTVNWYASNGSSGTSLDSLTPGNYTIEVIDEYGSVWIGSIDLSAPDPLSVDNVSITGSSGTNGMIQLTVSGGTDPYSFEWSNGAMTSGIRDLVPGIYYCTVTDANDCSVFLGPFEVPLISNTSALSANAEIMVMPSPFQADLGVTVRSIIPVKGGVISVHDILGKKIFEVGDLSGRLIRVDLNTSGWGPGIYIVRFKSHDQVVSTQVIKN